MTNLQNWLQAEILVVNKIDSGVWDYITGAYYSETYRGYGIKNGILLAGLGIATGSVVVPIIAAIGGLAISKKLNDKERLLLLDEIETELEVVEKELQIADSNNQMKKYRALLQYKKDLQRQYQRIRYNIRVRKDILPNSSTGVKKPE